MWYHGCPLMSFRKKDNISDETLFFNENLNLVRQLYERSRHCEVTLPNQLLGKGVSWVSSSKNTVWQKLSMSNAVTLQSFLWFLQEKKIRINMALESCRIIFFLWILKFPRWKICISEPDPVLLKPKPHPIIFGEVVDV